MERVAGCYMTPRALPLTPWPPEACNTGRGGLCDYAQDMDDGRARGMGQWSGYGAETPGRRSSVPICPTRYTDRKVQGGMAPAWNMVSERSHAMMEKTTTTGEPVCWTPPTPPHIEGSGGLDGYAYYLDRGNGQMTRLIPADVLPPLNEIPPRETRSLGMVVLPQLQAKSPGGPSQRATLKADASTSSLANKRNKIYCDKWIHEGVCAFTQQGCKFKHEMPFDEATQRSLGLFQGLPSWWRRRDEASRVMAPLAAMGSLRETAPESSWTDAMCWDNASRAQPTENPPVPFAWGPIGTPARPGMTKADRRSFRGVR
ncbi:hypothetical protein CDD81_7113 [Ophiocordyceps australis]|uniref:C3H1-type domain-containing protein n=1 Tax=Ophiocordyceps australis TaxID=1399860 RepID=A0A2C5Y458_9HYPO|nr:hypothetical protein CDD81_7113 [Ophiocordyceps australis]